MKRLILLAAAVASLAVAAPVGALAFAGGGDQGRRAERVERGRGPSSDRARGEWRGRRDEGRGERRRQDERPRYRDRDGDRPRYDERRRPEDRRRREYDDGPRRYGEPGAAARRGRYLPDGYRGGVVDDYRRYRLRPPPHGYAWVRMGNGFALVDLGSGRIFDRVD